MSDLRWGKCDSTVVWQIEVIRKAAVRSHRVTARNGKGGRTMGGCEGRLRSRLGAKVLSDGRRRRRLFFSAAEGLLESDRASQWGSHRRRLPIYESADSSGREDAIDKN